jgi:hypothetical protein
VGSDVDRLSCVSESDHSSLRLALPILRRRQIGRVMAPKDAAMRPSSVE